MHLQENYKNVRIMNGVVQGISERLVGYFRLNNGLLWGHNQEEISAQKDLIQDLLKKTGEKLLQGEDLTSISLPMEILEPRSVLERISDLWTAGPNFLIMAGKISDSTERFKRVIGFAIGGLYTACKQLKPFNPILGETFQGYWPDGTMIYAEQISHHPPISSFLVENGASFF